MNIFHLFAKNNINQEIEKCRNTPGAVLLDVRSKEEYDAMIQHLIDEKYVNNMYDWHGGELEYPWKGIVVTDDIGCGGLYDLKNIMRDMVKANETLENVYGKGE